VPAALLSIFRDVLGQELLGQRDVKTTMIYTHVLNQVSMGARSPADRLEASGL